MREITSHEVPGASTYRSLKVVVIDEPGAGGANHRYDIVQPNGMATSICFQDGPIGVAGVNGITQEALLAIVRDRLEGFQGGGYACDENAEALYHTHMALVALQRRTHARMARGVEGTNAA